MKINEIDFNPRNIFIFLAVLLAGFVVYKTSDVLLMLLIAVLIAYLLNPIVDFLERLKIKRIFGVFILAIITAGFIFLTLALVLPIILQHFFNFMSNFQFYVEKVLEFIGGYTEKFGVHTSLESVKPFLIERIGAISKYMLNYFTGALQSVKAVGVIVMNIVLVPFLVFFILKDFPAMKLFFTKIIERFGFQSVASHFSDFETILGRYFRGIFLDGLVLSVLYISVMLIVGVNGGIFLGFLTGMGGMIPYVGFTIGLIASLTVTAIQFQDLTHVLYVLVGYSIVQVLESFVITPKIVGDSLGLNPAMVIVGLALGGSLFGLFGMILSLPIVAFLKIMFDRVLAEEKVKK